MSQNTEDFAYVLPARPDAGQEPGKVSRRSLDHWLAKGFTEVDRKGAPLTEPAEKVGGPVTTNPEADPASDSGTAAENADTTVPASDTPKTTGRAGRGR